jgi:hypothetical protein
VKIVLHPHARLRARERGATEAEVEATVAMGEQFPVRYGRMGFRRNLSGNYETRGRTFHNKQIEVYAVREADQWLVITVIVKLF